MSDFVFAGPHPATIVPRTLFIPFEVTFNADGTILGAGRFARDTEVVIRNLSPLAVRAHVSVFSEFSELIAKVREQLATQSLAAIPEELETLRQRIQIGETARAGGELVLDFTVLIRGLEPQFRFSVAEVLRGGDPRAHPCPHGSPAPNQPGPFGAAFLFQILGLLSKVPNRSNIVTNPIHGYITIDDIENTGKETSLRAEYYLKKGTAAPYREAASIPS